ncbi:uncharacterized protein CXorf65 homolog [Chelonia mydas]|uniref:uncharacterized protein CXorf65 homolog n=1 Tax=Chelonia mydas TaxID=8469 RepID=UPI001CA946AB|nr:uncharacterized protein CXorf65 homolog [Chelonia mydas]
MFICVKHAGGGGSLQIAPTCCIISPSAEPRGRPRPGCVPSPGSGTALSLPDNQQFLANTGCSVLLLLHYLRSKVGLQRTEAIDLCDELGTLKLLFLVKLPSDSASKFLSPRGTYYVCRVERGAPGTKQENAYRAFTPILKDPEPELLDALRTQCEFLEKSRLKLLKAQDGKKIQTMESLISIVPSQISGKLMGRPGPGAAGAADEEGAQRKAGASPKIKPEASKKEKHR